MRSQALHLSRTALAVLLLAGLGASAQMKSEGHRKAFGEDRASVMESVLTALYPGAEVKWEPTLTLRVPGQKEHTAEVPVVVRGREGGGIEGVASIELDQKKEQYIFGAKNFARTDNQAFSTVVVVFRADAAGHFEKYKKFILDPGEPVTELKTMTIQDWPANQDWPTLVIQYDTHVASPDSFATIEWRSIVDANTGKIVTRWPYGITRKVKGAAQQVFGFSMVRDSPATIEITDHFNGAKQEYSCSDPCVVDRQTLLSQWIH